MTYITYMTIQEAKEFFETTEFSPETKEKIMAVLNSKTILDEEAISQIKVFMKEELDKDF